MNPEPNNQTMKPEQQRIAIAEACGWDCDPLIAREWKSRGQWARKTTDDQNKLVSLRSNVPEYPNDLNAMHEAEKTLSQKDKREYAYQLNGGYYTSGLDDTFDIVHATAAQRAEAFLRTIGKWATNQNEPDPHRFCRGGGGNNFHCGCKYDS